MIPLKVRWIHGPGNACGLSPAGGWQWKAQRHVAGGGGGTQMLQTLLADRFRLAIRSENQLQEAWALIPG